MDNINFDDLLAMPPPPTSSWNDPNKPAGTASAAPSNPLADPLSANPLGAPLGGGPNPAAKPAAGGGPLGGPLGAGGGGPLGNPGSSAGGKNDFDINSLMSGSSFGLSPTKNNNASSNPLHSNPLAGGSSSTISSTAAISNPLAGGGIGGSGGNLSTGIGDIFGNPNPNPMSAKPTGADPLSMLGLGGPGPSGGMSGGMSGGPNLDINASLDSNTFGGPNPMSGGLNQGVSANLASGNRGFNPNDPDNINTNLMPNPNLQALTLPGMQTSQGRNQEAVIVDHAKKVF
jgi:hypothetical protein